MPDAGPGDAGEGLGQGLAAARPPALRLLAGLWLAELAPSGAAALAGLRDLAPHLPTTAAGFQDLAAEHHRLLGLNLPPYESVFVDPSAMLEAPATALVRRLYARGDWAPPPGARVAAADHLGLELAALADWLDGGRTGPARALVSRHLGLWLPPFVLALRGLAPHPFYAAVGELSLDLVLSLLAEDGPPSTADPFPDLPPPPVYRASAEELDPGPGAAGPPEAEAGPGTALRRLLRPRDAGLYLSPTALRRIAAEAGLPTGGGDRYQLLEGLLRAAAAYEAGGSLGAALARHLAEQDDAYRALAEAWPAWAGYGAAWRRRLDGARLLLDGLVGGAEDGAAASSEAPS